MTTATRTSFGPDRLLIRKSHIQKFGRAFGPFLLPRIPKDASRQFRPSVETHTSCFLKDKVANCFTSTARTGRVFIELDADVDAVAGWCAAIID